MKVVVYGNSGSGKSSQARALAGAYEPPPPSAASDYVVKLEQMSAIAAGKGKDIHLCNDVDHGFRGLSFIHPHRRGVARRCIPMAARRTMC